MLVGRIACSCGRHLTWCCECGAATYGPALAYGCGLLDGPIALLVDVDSAFTQFTELARPYRLDDFEAAEIRAAIDLPRPARGPTRRGRSS
jgi:hypothetical protein